MKDITILPTLSLKTFILTFQWKHVIFKFYNWYSLACGRPRQKTGLLLMKLHRLHSTLLRQAIPWSIGVRSFHDSISPHKRFSALTPLPSSWAISYLSSKIKIKSLAVGKAFLDLNRQRYLYCPLYSTALRLILGQNELPCCAVMYLLNYLLLLLQCRIPDGRRYAVFIFVSLRYLIYRSLITVYWIN